MCRHHPLCDVWSDLFFLKQLLSEEEIDDILAKEGRIVARCEFCNEEYSVERPEIMELRKAGAWAPRTPSAGAGGEGGGSSS